jgi:ferrous iron transport protein B
VSGLLNFSREKYLKVTSGAAGLIDEIEKVAESVYEKGFKNIFLIGSGGAVATFYPFDEVSESDPALIASIASMFTAVSAYAFMAFNLLCAPCFAAVGAIKREMGGWKWTLIAVGYQTILAYMVSLMIYQIGSFITGDISFDVGTVAALIVLGGMLWLLLSPNKPAQKSKKSID